jgi:hypothetical protein
MDLQAGYGSDTIRQYTRCRDSAVRGSECLILRDDDQCTETEERYRRVLATLTVPSAFIPCDSGLQNNREAGTRAR